MVIYFVIFGAGVAYILKLMHHAPALGERGVRVEPGPIRTSGITPERQMRESGRDIAPETS